jgi:hypothetical protein
MPTNLNGHFKESLVDGWDADLDDMSHVDTSDDECADDGDMEPEILPKAGSSERYSTKRSRRQAGGARGVLDDETDLERPMKSSKGSHKEQNRTESGATCEASDDESDTPTLFNISGLCDTTGDNADANVNDSGDDNGENDHQVIDHEAVSTMSLIDSVHYFSKINISCYQAPGFWRKRFKNPSFQVGPEVGNSREDLVKFQFRCPNAKHG